MSSEPVFTVWGARTQAIITPFGANCPNVGSYSEEDMEHIAGESVVLVDALAYKNVQVYYFDLDNYEDNYVKMKYLLYESGLIVYVQWARVRQVAKILEDLGARPVFGCLVWQLEAALGAGAAECGDLVLVDYNGGCTSDYTVREAAPKCVTAPSLQLCPRALSMTYREVYRLNYLTILRNKNYRVIGELLRARKICRPFYEYVDHVDDSESGVCESRHYKLAWYSDAMQVFNAAINEFERLFCLWAVRAMEQAAGQECPLDIKRVLCALVLG